MPVARPVAGGWTVMRKTLRWLTGALAVVMLSVASGRAGTGGFARVAIGSLPGSAEGESSDECVGPGLLLPVSATLSFGGPGSIAASLDAVIIDPGLSVVPDSCTATAGVCMI